MEASLQTIRYIANNCTRMASTVPQESVSAAAFGDEFAPKILHLSVNHDGLSFAVALQNGYRVYAVEPLKELYRQG